MAKNKVKLDNETLKAIWDASRPSIERNKKKYNRKKKQNHKKYNFTNIKIGSLPPGFFDYKFVIK